MLPTPTARLRFREMVVEDLDDMAALLGDPDVMHFYPHAKSREEALAWIEWSRRSYADHGYGLWIIETHDGRFVGDCGLTWQRIDGELDLEVGYHVVPELQRHGYATEAAASCLDLALQDSKISRVIAIVHPQNTASRRVAERLGMVLWKAATGSNGLPVVVYST